MDELQSTLLTCAQHPVVVVNSHRVGHVLTRLLLVQPAEAANDDKVATRGETCCGPIQIDFS